MVGPAGSRAEAVGPTKNDPRLFADRSGAVGGELAAAWPLLGQLARFFSPVA